MIPHTTTDIFKFEICCCEVYHGKYRIIQSMKLFLLIFLLNVNHIEKCFRQKL